MSNEIYHYHKHSDHSKSELGEFGESKYLLHITNRLQRITNQLPLENCIFTTDGLTNDSGYLAPEGMAFRVTGFFEQSCQTGGDEINLAPTFPSFHLWKDNLHNNPEETSYWGRFNQLISLGLDKSKAYVQVYSEMQEDLSYWPNKLLKHFDGKILVIPNLNLTSNNIDKQSQLLIKQPKLTTHIRECLGVIEIPYEGEMKSVFYDSDQANIINWYEPIAIVNLFHHPKRYKISLIKSNKFDNHEIVIPNHIDKKITTPYPTDY